MTQVSCRGMAYEESEKSELIHTPSLLALLSTIPREFLDPMFTGVLLISHTGST